MEHLIVPHPKVRFTALPAMALINFARTNVPDYLTPPPLRRKISLITTPPSKKKKIFYFGES